MNDSSIPPPGHALANSPSKSVSSQPATGFERALGALRHAIPVVQRLLPLLDGNYGTAVSNLLNPQPQAPPPPPPIDLTPVEDSLAALHAAHQDLRGQILVQNAALKRVEDQLEMVGDATDRITFAHKELAEELKIVARKVTVFAFVGLGLLAISIALSVILFLHIRRVLP
ncbi:MAG: hypothetical protein ABSE51_10265 [Terracidiphilus sp.]